MKAKIQERTGIPSEQQRLIFTGRQLDNEKTLSEYQFDTSRELRMYLDFQGNMQIFVQMPSGSNIHVEGIYTVSTGKQMCLKVSKRMSTIQIKSLIEYQIGIPRYLQVLLFSGMELENDKCLDDYNIQANSTLNITIEESCREKLEIEVETSSGTCQVQVYSNDSVAAVKKKTYWYGYRTLSPNPLHLFDGGVLLEDEKLLQDYMITNGSTLYLCPSGEIPVLVDTSTTQLCIGVKTTDTVEKLRTKCLEKEQIPSDHQFFLGSIPLVDSFTIADYDITAASILHVLGPGEIPICIKTRTGQIFLGINPSDTVQSVKTKISEREQIPEDQQRVIFHQQQLESGGLTLDYHIFAGATLHLAVIPDELELYISTPSGNTLTMICLLEDTVADVKRKIAESEGVPVEHQVLPCGGDDRTLREENMKPGTHLDVGKSLTRLY